MRKMQGGGGSKDGIVKLARRAAAAARTERAALVAALRPPWVRNNYNGVHKRKDRYYAVIWNIHTARQLWLGSYATPEEAAYAYDAAARVTRGHKARPNFPAPARAEMSTAPVLALPACRERDRAKDVAAQASFDNWLLAGMAAAEGPQQQQQQQQQQGAPAATLLPHHHHQQQPTLVSPFTQFFYLADHATAAAAANGGAAAVVFNPSPSNLGAYVLTPQNVQMSPTNPASTELSSTEPVVDTSQFLSAGAAGRPTQHREPPVSQQAGVSDLAVVEDNFSMFTVTDDGASSSTAFPPVAPVPWLTLDLLLQVGLPGRGGPGWAQ